MRTALVAIPYRDAYFVRRYGMVVRDVRVIDEIRRMNAFSEVVVVNRPVSLHERALLLKRKAVSEWPHLRTFDFTTPDLLGPLRGRKWIARLYPQYLRQVSASLIGLGVHQAVVLDFHPLAFIARSDFGALRTVLWHDAIDNFAKHPRFSSTERDLVTAKYRHVQRSYDLVTGVSQAVCEHIGHHRHFAFCNGLYDDGAQGVVVDGGPRFDFGFIGFVTNKFDVGIVERLVALGFSVAIYGRVLDGEIHRRLRRLGIHLAGEFSSFDIPAIVNSFGVGLIPYLPALEHDGSPLKLYEYLRFNRPVLTSVDYEFSSPYVKNYKRGDDVEALANEMLGMAGDPEISSSIGSEFRLSVCVRTAVEMACSLIDDYN